MQNKTKWISLTWNKKKFNWSFNLFGLKFNFRITKKVLYSSRAKRIKNINESVSSGEIGSLSGFKVFQTGHTTTLDK